MTHQNLPAMTLAAALVFGASTAQAVEVTGSSLGLSYSAFTEDTDFNRLGLEGSVELGFNRNFGLQMDAGYNNFDASGADSTTLGLHGIYHMDAATSLGAFYTREDLDGGELDILGAEAGYEINAWDFEGYLAHVDSNAGDGTLGGLQARYVLASGLGLTGAYDRFEADGDDLSRVSVKLDRDVSHNANLYLEIGSANLDIGGISESEPFVGLGGKINLGASRGATFEQRGLTRLIPGL